MGGSHNTIKYTKATTIYCELLLKMVGCRCGHWLINGGSFHAECSKKLRNAELQFSPGTRQSIILTVTTLFTTGRNVSRAVIQCIDMGTIPRWRAASTDGYEERPGTEDCTDSVRDIKRAKIFRRHDRSNDTSELIEEKREQKNNRPLRARSRRDRSEAASIGDQSWTENPRRIAGTGMLELHRIHPRRTTAQSTVEDGTALQVQIA